MALPIPLTGAVVRRLAFGLAAYLPEGILMSAHVPYADVPHFPLPDRPQTMGIHLGVGIDVGHGVRIGAGASSLASLGGSVRLVREPGDHTTAGFDAALKPTLAPVVGATIDLGSSLRLGLVYRGELAAAFRVVIDTTRLSYNLPDLHISGIAQYDPWQVGVELARIRGPWRAAVGATYKHWSAYPGAIEATVQCPAVDPSTGEAIAGPCNAKPPDPPGYRDTLVPRAAVERLVPIPHGTLALRAGFFFDPTPLRAATRASQQLDASRAVVTLGYGLNLDRLGLAVNAFGQIHALLPRDGTTGAGTVTTTGTVIAVGADATVTF